MIFSDRTIKEAVGDGRITMAEIAQLCERMRARRAQRGGGGERVATEGGAVNPDRGLDPVPAHDRADGHPVDGNRRIAGQTASPAWREIHPDGR